MKKSFIWIVFCLMLLPLFSCGKKAPSETLKIGIITAMSYPVGLDMARGIEVLADMANKKGGLTVGDKTYKVELVTYDSKMSDSDSRSAVERLIFQDKVNFILGDQTVDAWVSITEQNKIIAIVGTPSPAIFKTSNKYVFQGNQMNTAMPQNVGWLAEKFPKVKTIVTANSDTAFGKVFDGVFRKLYPAFGFKILAQLSYPIDATDLSSLGTRVANLKPDAYVDFMCPSYKAVFQAGWKGLQIPAGSISQTELHSNLSAEAMEGMILPGLSTDLEDPKGLAGEFKEAFIAKNGKWGDPNVSFANAWCILVAALEQAKTLDPDKIAEVIGSGLEYQTHCGEKGIMISRPDLGIDKTMDTIIGGQPMFKMVNGKPELIELISLEKALEYNRKYYGWK